MRKKVSNRAIIETGENIELVEDKPKNIQKIAASYNEVSIKMNELEKEGYEVKHIKQMTAGRYLIIGRLKDGFNS